MEPPPWELLTTIEPSSRATRVSPPGHDLDRVAVDGERAQVDRPRRHLALAHRRRAGEPDDLLGDPAGRVFLEQPPLLDDLGLGRGRADEDALAAGLARRLDDHLLEPPLDVLALLGIVHQPGRHVGQHRLLVQVVADHRRHVVVDRLVVGDAGADRVRDRDVALAAGPHQAGHAEQRVGPELERVDEVLVDAAIDRVDPLQPVGRLQVAGGVADDEIGGLDELDPHLPGEEGVLEVGAVGRPRRPDDDDRAADPAGAARDERVEQQLRVVGDRAHRLAREQLRHQPAHRDPVLEHVGDAGGHPDVVLEHAPEPLAIADQVAAGDVAPDAARRLQAVRGPGEARPGDDEPPGDDPVADDLALAVDVGDEPVQGLDPLADAVGDEVPLGRRDDPRDQVERERPVARLAVGPGRVEGDPALHEDRVPSLGRRLQVLAAEPVQRLDHRPGVRMWLAGRGEALVETAGRRLVGDRLGGVARSRADRLQALGHQRSSSAKASVAAATSRRRSAPSISVSKTAERTPSGGGSGSAASTTIPSISPS